jgi:hypothetical protein
VEEDLYAGWTVWENASQAKTEGRGMTWPTNI